MTGMDDMLAPIERTTRARWWHPNGPKDGYATDAQLAGEACMRCGSHHDLVDKGRVQVGMTSNTARVCKGRCGATL